MRTFGGVATLHTTFLTFDVYRLTAAGPMHSDSAREDGGSLAARSLALTLTLAPLLALTLTLTLALALALALTLSRDLH